MEVAKLLDITKTADQISTSHRFQSRNKRDNTMPTVSTIIVLFVSRDIGNNVYFNRKLIRTAVLKNFPVESTSSIFINENLPNLVKNSSGEQSK